MEKDYSFGECKYTFGWFNLFPLYDSEPNNMPTEQTPEFIFQNAGINNADRQGQLTQKNIIAHGGESAEFFATEGCGDQVSGYF